MIKYTIGGHGYLGIGNGGPVTDGCYEFDEKNGKLYAGTGGAEPGWNRTGGSGIVIIRNVR